MSQLTPPAPPTPTLQQDFDEDVPSVEDDNLHEIFANSPVPDRTPVISASQPAPVRSGFVDAFRGVSPAPVSQPNAEAVRPSRPIPEHYRRHWERVPEILKNVPLQPTGVEAACMTPTHEHEGKMFSESKCFSLVRANSVDVLAGPQNGVSYCFVAEATTELPLHIQEAIYFFNACSNKYQAQDRSPFVFPTKDIGLQVSALLAACC
jgi:hypothetical protein